MGTRLYVDTEGYRTLGVALWTLVSMCGHRWVQGTGGRSVGTRLYVDIDGYRTLGVALWAPVSMWTYMDTGHWGSPYCTPSLCGHRCRLTCWVCGTLGYRTLGVVLWVPVSMWTQMGTGHWGSLYGHPSLCGHRWVQDTGGRSSVPRLLLWTHMDTGHWGLLYGYPSLCGHIWLHSTLGGCFMGTCLYVDIDVVCLVRFAAH
jgi:hypothetical protein